MTLTPYIPADAEATLTARASAVATKISEGLRYATLEEAIAEIRTSKVTPINLVDHFVGLLKKAAASALVDAGNSTATEAIAMGRQHEAEIYRDEVKVVEYSALLDDATCDACRKADGQKLKMGTAKYAELQPPNRDCRGRGRCRCVYVYILEDEGPAGAGPGPAKPAPKGPTLVPPPIQPKLIPPPAHVPMLPPPKLVPISASPIPLAPKLPVKVTPKAMPPIALVPPKPIAIVAPAPAKPRAPTILPHYRADVAAKAKGFISAGQTETQLENSFIRGELKKKIATDVGVIASKNPTLVARAGDARAAIFEADTGRKLTPLEKARLSGPDQVRGDIESRTGDISRVWAQTSVDSHMRAIAAQVAAVEEFKLGTAAMTKLKAQVTRQGSQGTQAWKDAQEILAKPGEKEMMKVTLRAMHENTQAAFKAQGITHVAITRGMAIDLDQLPASVRDKLGRYDPDAELWHRNKPTSPLGPAPSAEAKMQLQPMSSTAAEFEIAHRFASYADVRSGAVTVILRGTVPVELIVGTARTGMGCLHEYEMVTLAGEGKWTIELAEPLQGAMIVPKSMAPKL